MLRGGDMSVIDQSLYQADIRSGIDQATNKQVAAQMAGALNTEMAIDTGEQAADTHTMIGVSLLLGNEQIRFGIPFRIPLPNVGQISFELLPNLVIQVIGTRLLPFVLMAVQANPVPDGTGGCINVFDLQVGKVDTAHAVPRTQEHHA